MLFILLQHLPPSSIAAAEEESKVVVALADEILNHWMKAQGMRNLPC